MLVQRLIRLLKFDKPINPYNDGHAVYNSLFFNFWFFYIQISVSNIILQLFTRKIEIRCLFII